MALAVIRSRPILLRSLLPSFLSSRSSSSSSNDFKSPLIASLVDFPSPSPAGDPNLSALLHLVSAAKSHSTSQQEALTLLRSSSAIRPTEDLVCSALWELRGDWESAALVFKWDRDCVAECPRAWHVMIWVLGSERRFDLAWSLLRRMRRKSVLTATAMVIMMERYAAANEVSKAIKTFHAMEKFKLNADSSTFYALLHALCKNKNIEEAEELLLLNRKNFPLETEGFNIVLNGWSNIIIDVVEAKRVWREMSNCCITPDGTSYSHMICCFSKVGNLFDALRLYDQMKKRGWVPGLVVYNSLISALTRENCLKEAKKIFDKIVETGLKPDIETYNSMIYPLCEAFKVEEAQEIMDGMIKNGIHPTIETYHAFAKAKDIEGTLKLLNRMKDVGYCPDRATLFF